MGRGHLGAWPRGPVPLPRSTHRAGLATGGMPRGGGSWEPVRRLLPPQRPGGAAGQGGAHPLPAPPPAPPHPTAAEAPPQACRARWLRFWFHFLRPGLFPSPFPQPFESLVPPPLSSLSANVPSSGRLSGTTQATGTSPQGSLLIPSFLGFGFFFKSLTGSRDYPPHLFIFQGLFIPLRVNNTSPQSALKGPTAPLTPS